MAGVLRRGLILFPYCQQKIRPLSLLLPLPFLPLKTHLSDDRSRREGREREREEGESNCEEKGGEGEGMWQPFSDLISDPRAASRVTSGAPCVTELVDDGSV